MKKVIKKLGALMTVVALFASITPAMQVKAADNNTLTIHKYAGDAWNSTTYPNNGTEITTLPADVQALKNVEFKITKMSDDTTTVDNGTVDNSFTAKTGTTASDGSLSFTGLKDGIYKVEETSHSAVVNNGGMSPFIVKLPMTNPAGTGYLTTVHVYPKNQIKTGPTITKTVSTAGSSTILETVTYSLTVNIPDDIATAVKYDITDTLDAKLSLVTSSIVAKTVVDAVETTIPTSEYTNNSTSSKLSLSMKDSAEVTAAAGKKLVITFNAQILETAKNTTIAIPNDATVEYTNSFDVVQNNTSAKVYVTIANINISKVKKGDAGTKLAGAKFKLYTDAACTKAVKEPGKSNDYEVISAADGTAKFEGIIAGTYYVKETMAPAGYQLLASPITATITAVSGNTTITHVSLSVENASNEGFKLPLTGGSGTLVFTIGGIALVGLAVIFFIRNKSKA